MKTEIRAIQAAAFEFFDRHAEGVELLSCQYDAHECFGMLGRVIERARAALEDVPEQGVRALLRVGDSTIALWAESGGMVRHNGAEQPFTPALAKHIHPLDMLALVAKSLRLAPVTILGEKNGLPGELEVTLERLCAAFALTRAIEGAKQIKDPVTTQMGAYNLMQAASAVGLIEPFTSVPVGSLKDEIATRVRSKNAATGGQRKAANAKPNPEKTIAQELKRKNPSLSAMQIKTRGKLKKSERTISSWISEVC